MAQEYTSAYPATFLEPFGELLADYTVSELGRPVDISGILPRVAAIDPFTKAAQQRAAKQAGLGSIQYDPEGRIIGFGGGTGIAAYEPFLRQAAAQVQAGPSGYQQYMSPYQQDVIDEAVRRQQEYGAQREQQLAASAVGQGAFGQSRYDVAKGQLQRGTTEAIGKTVADLQAQNYAQAIGRQQQGIANLLAIPGIEQQFEQATQSGLGAYGAGSQQYAQNILNALQQGEQTALNFPFERIGTAKNIFTGLASGTPFTPGVPLTTDPRVAAMTGIGSLARPSIPFSNVLGDVVKGAGNILGDIFSSSRTPTTFPDSGGYDFESIYSDPYRTGSQGDIYSTGDYIF
jgi:hypothetical protein